MLDQVIEKRSLPDILTFLNGEKVTNAEQWRKRRQEIKEILCREEYGFFYPQPMNLKAEILEKDETFCAGNACLTKVRLTVALENGEFSFPIYCSIPKGSQSYPAFLHINFRDAVPDKYMPSEELCDNGFAVVSFCYEDVTTDDGDFSNGLAGLMYGNKERNATSPGKIAIWSWAAMRVMDYMQTLDEIDKKNIAVVGHSRLGKTALLTGAFDERFAVAVSNNSGCSGAALSREKNGEHIKDICNRFPFWFCLNYQKYADNEYAQPFDQHFLLALLAPRKVYVASASEDGWADPISEYLSCVGADSVYQVFGKKGFICPDRLPQTGEKMHEGNIGYHLRSGKHYFSRYDWQNYMEYILKHKNL